MNEAKATGVKQKPYLHTAIKKKKKLASIRNTGRPNLIVYHFYL
jgi:hypothetical protein